MRRPPSALIALLLASAVGGCGGGGRDTESATATTGGRVVTVEDNAFDPTIAAVDVGGTVVWEFKDDARHHVLGGNGAFESGDVAKGGAFSYTFTKVGSYPYTCRIHTTMKGVVSVR